MSLEQVNTRVLPAVLLIAALSVSMPASAALQPPEPPQDVAGESQPDGTFLLSWQPPVNGGADGYRVYEDGELVAELTLLSHQMGGTALASVYTVTAFNEHGEGQHSNPILRTPGNQQSACIILLPLPPLVQPSACENVVKGIIWWLQEFLCPGCTIWHVLRTGSMIA